MNHIDLSFKTLANKSVFLTGGTGFFGKSFLDLYVLYAKDYNIQLTVLSRSPETFLQTYPKYNHSNIKFIKGDIVDFDFPFGRFDTILHFATPADATLNILQPETMNQIITLGMQRVIDFAKRCECKEFLFTSSGAVYGQQPSDLTHVPETYTGAPITNAPDAAYGEAKRYSELLGCISARKYGFQFKIARCFAFTGPHLSQNGTFAIANFIRDAQNGLNIEIKGDGTPYRSYLYADDLIVWLLTILSRGKNCEIYNVGSDKDLTITDLAMAVKNTINPSIHINIHQKPKENAKPSRYVPSINKARNELNLEVWTSLEEAILKSKI